MSEESNKQCSICFRRYTEFGHPAEPVRSGRCCNVCNDLVVIPARLRAARKATVAPPALTAVNEDHSDFLAGRHGLGVFRAAKFLICIKPSGEGGGKHARPALTSADAEDCPGKNVRWEHPMMSFQHIRYFLVLCEEQNFTRAAKRCGITQPSLTNAMKRLEDLLGGPLFHRARKPASVTEPTGLALVVKPYFEQAHLAVEAAQHKASKLKVAKHALMVSTQEECDRPLPHCN